MKFMWFHEEELGSWGAATKTSLGRRGARAVRDLQLQIQGWQRWGGFALRKSKQKQDKQVFGRLISVIFH